MESVDIEKAVKLYTFDDLYRVAEDIDDQLQKQTDLLERPDSIVQRIFVDLFGSVALYTLLFLMCDITQSIINDTKLFGVEWFFFGPYYFFTGAPLMTRVWKSKKFLEDLSDLNRGGISFNIDQTCTTIGAHYKTECEREGQPHQRPLRQKLGAGLDWLLRHTVGKHFGGIFGNATCEDQSTTIASDCAWDRVLALWGAYNGFCDLYPDLISRRAEDINWPNTVSMNSGYVSQFNDHEKAAYQMYFEGYTKIYDIGSTVFTGHGTPTNLITDYDDYTYYSYNVNKLWGLNGFMPPNSFAYLNFPPPSWYWSYYNGSYTTHYEANQRAFQENYKENQFEI